MTTLSNPFSASLKKHPFIDMQKEPLYKNGDFKIYKYFDRHYVHTYKNIVIAERCAPNTDLIHNLIFDKQIKGKNYFDFERCKEAISQGIEAAKNLNFIIQ